MTSSERIKQLSCDEELRWSDVDEVVLRVISIEHCCAPDQGYPADIECQFFKVQTLGFLGLISHFLKLRVNDIIRELGKNPIRDNFII